MEYVFLFVGLYFLIMFFPWYINYYSDGDLKAQLIMFGFIRVPINLKRVMKNFTTRKTNEERPFNIMEVLENIKKMSSISPITNDFFKRANIKHFYWYSALPMTTPILGLALLPIYTTAQGVVLEFIQDHFHSIKDVDVDTKFNYVNDDVFLYFDCIIQTNLGKIIFVSLKYVKKIPVLFKRVS